MKKKIPLLLASTLTASMLLGACSYQKDDAKAKGKENTTSSSNGKQVLNLTELSEIPSMDASLASDSASSTALNNTMEGLYRIGKDQKRMPGIAEDVQKLDDGKKYIFKLRKDAKWSNGEPVTAKDFVYSWKRAVNPDTKATYSYIMFDIKNAEKIHKKELPADQLGVKAIDDYTLEVELDNPVPYFVDLTVYPVFYPLNENFVKAQGDKFGLEANTTLYNGPFVMSDWKHEQSFQFKKNPSYWDNKTVKIEEINFNIVKNTSTDVNLYETNSIDRAALTSEFVDKFRQSSEFHTRKEAGVAYLRFNQSNQYLSNKNLRKAISMSFDRDNIAKVILNNGAIGAYGFVGKDFAEGPNKKDFRAENGKLVETNPKEAKKLWETAKKELGTDKIELEFLNFDNEDAKKVGEFLKGEMEKNLPGLSIKIKQQPFAQKNKLEDSQQYDIAFGIWGPDFPDPISYLDMFVTNGSQNKTGYSNQKYDELILKAKTDTKDLQARWNNLLEVEKMLIKEDAVITPIFQKGSAYIVKDAVKDIIPINYGGRLTYKWASVEQK
ncbi:peptide ABC transporter substrate-binding protein [Bacillus thuringiensis serovar kyushuensis]|uniref:peptide ABC transporter substrate-binding protein n=1 Tax=Bacillus cereus group TaxID=86661 RepID=UPI000B44ECBE|nr:peptide ABC transporter substrate-binding protein [Bacillus thuringiensis]MDA1666789.1 peptide ABC transporter substrate-binding protein [Bacillus cereus]MDA1767662.1 peptide ABC transporter substrate-binding protein [Bacillus cereus]MEC2861495.1 peptide ABC transporter substrate-binding protein [Bacillus cereus]OTZ63634.1 peptide ABC transporter substrate-binding protein [Bacillus thuringiensis serovar kyushuensis]OTZ74077.1 peptide ABC transporter substrate-binding protein [Bacillus thuri